MTGVGEAGAAGPPPPERVEVREEAPLEGRYDPAQERPGQEMNLESHSFDYVVEDRRGSKRRDSLVALTVPDFLGQGREGNVERPAGGKAGPARSPAAVVEGRDLLVVEVDLTDPVSRPDQRAVGHGEGVSSVAGHTNSQDGPYLGPRTGEPVKPPVGDVVAAHEEPEHALTLTRPLEVGQGMG